MRLETLRQLFEEIGAEAATAVNNGDHETYADLTRLVIALEACYPAMMAQLRNEGVVD